MTWAWAQDWEKNRLRTSSRWYIWIEMIKTSHILWCSFWLPSTRTFGISICQNAPINDRVQSLELPRLGKWRSLRYSFRLSICILLCHSDNCRDQTSDNNFEGAQARRDQRWVITQARNPRGPWSRWALRYVVRKRPWTFEEHSRGGVTFTIVDGCSGGQELSQIAMPQIARTPMVT